MPFRRHLLALAALGASILGCSSAGLTNAAGASSGNPAPGDDTSGGDDGGATGEAGPRDPGKDADGGTLPPPTSAVTISVMPDKTGYDALVSAIKGATKSVHMEMYLLSDTTVINALISLHGAGKDVKVVLNHDFPNNEGSNSSVYAQLKGAGVSVVYAPAGYQYTHTKLVVIDGARALVMTMNLTQSSPWSNREFIATDTDAADVADAEKIFAADYANMNASVNGKLLFSPVMTSTPDVRARLVALMDSAKSTLDVEGEELSDTAITDAIIAAKKAGVTVRVVLDAGTPTTAQQTAIDKLKAAGVAPVAVNNPTIHAKSIVADGARAYVGSMNFTYNSLNANREVGLITDATSEIAKMTSAIDSDYAAGTAL